MAAAGPLVRERATRVRGLYLYHLAQDQVAVGLIVDLNYQNPWLSPFDEFQRLKHHPSSRQRCRGERISYGARAITKGGWHSLPRMHFPGGLLIGCDAGTLDFSRIKGIHTAMKSGMVAAATVAMALRGGDEGDGIWPSFRTRCCKAG